MPLLQTREIKKGGEGLRERYRCFPTCVLFMCLKFVSQQAERRYSGRERKKEMGRCGRDTGVFLSC